ncbi:hypothetical protein BO78DRAFT_438043 [Aspergillus sclerotiicarbonarius CBS 121057]|uniref:F-box domain-containing protein n=1 Tax=Aspergillus sclerotiicarbonarius (strain CBS 121057 / IBT 28362) TaxID=1448318 RepID=A0A319EGG1_ASPSB|nr:hypothetical protein BO78DRAFT_438043 [Aspergillus sclerotiicarbonarius CBS 121057]
MARMDTPGIGYPDMKPPEIERCAAYSSTSSPTKDKPPHPAQTKFLATPDTLLILFHHLPPHDLLVSQRVCSLWNTPITNTHTLQCILGFRFPSSPAPEIPTFNPLLQWLFPPFFATDVSTRTSPYFMPETTHSLRFSHDDTYRERVFREDASWRRMRPMDVPCRIQKLVVHCRVAGNDDGESAAYRVFDDWARQDPVLGADMRLVWDFVLCGLGAYAERGMVVQWVPRRKVEVEDGDEEAEKEKVAPFECSVLVGQKSELKRGSGKFRFSCLMPPVDMKSKGWEYLGGKNQVEVDEWQAVRKEEERRRLREEKTRQKEFERSLLWKPGKGDDRAGYVRNDGSDGDDEDSKEDGDAEDEDEDTDNTDEEDDSDDSDGHDTDEDFDYSSDSDVRFPGGPDLDTTNSGDEWDWDAAITCSRNSELSWRI